VGVDPFVEAFGFGGTVDNPAAPFEIDTLRGGPGNNVFSLGDNGTIFGVERGDPALYYFGGEDADYALIRDFTFGDDTIQIAADVAPDKLEFDLTSNGLPQGISISFNNDLIAVIQGDFESQNDLPGGLEQLLLTDNEVFVSA